MTAQTERPNADNIVLLDGEPERPKWLARKYHKRWKEKVDGFRKRGLSVKGFEDMLAHYVTMMVDVETKRKAGLPVDAATMNQLRIFGKEFYDTPLSTDQGKHGPKGRPGVPAGNPFGERGVQNRGT